MAKKKNWLLIILGIVIFVVIVGVAAIVGFGYWMFKQMDFHQTTANAQQQFDDLRARFQGQKPYVELTISDNHEESTVHRELEQSSRTTLNKLRIAVYDEREHRLVQLALPFWLLRLGGNKPINLRQGSSGFDPGVRISVTTEDLERRGPGLVLDTVGRRGDRVLIWSEQ